MAKRPITKQIVSMSLTIGLLKRLQAVAKRHDRSTSYIVERCIEEFLPVLENAPVFDILERVKDTAQCSVEDGEELLKRLITESLGTAFEQMQIKPKDVSLSEDRFAFGFEETGEDAVLGRRYELGLSFSDEQQEDQGKEKARKNDSDSSKKPKAKKSVKGK